MSTHSTNTNATCSNNNTSLKPPFADFNFNDTDCVENARKHVNGILAPEPSFMPPPAVAALSGAVSNLNEESKECLAATAGKCVPSQDSANGREVLDHMARLDFTIDTEKGGTLISFHMEYQDYLDENYFMDQD
jgi:hypothetical protein